MGKTFSSKVKKANLVAISHPEYCYRLTPIELQMLPGRIYASIKKLFRDKYKPRKGQILSDKKKKSQENTVVEGSIVQQ